MAKHIEQPGFGSGQWHNPGGSGHELTQRIVNVAAKTEFRCRALCIARPPEYGPDAGDEFTRLKGFGQIVIRPALKAFDPVFGFSHCREHQDRHHAGLP